MRKHLSYSVLQTSGSYQEFTFASARGFPESTFGRLNRPMATISRRSLLRAGAAAGVTASALSVSSSANAKMTAPNQIFTGGGSLTHGVASGDVTTDSAVLWARASRGGQIFANITDSSGHGMLRWVNVTSATDYTGQIKLSGLKPGEQYTFSMHLQNFDGTCAPVEGSFRTAPNDISTSVSFVWTGDTAGQGWGRHAERGMWAYKAMAATKADFFIHSGDTVYADGPMSETVVLPDGREWRNVIVDGVEKVAESLDEFRGRHRYNMGDQHVQAMYAHMPVIGQWDDHETVNNWYPGEMLEDDRYQNERRVSVLAERARRAFTEYFPIDDRRSDSVGKVYRKICRGPLMDVFVIDMRTYRAANSANLQDKESAATAFLGEEQVAWLVRELKASTAVWKVIASDMPLGLVVGDGDNFENMANANDGVPLGRELEFSRMLTSIKDVKNVVWFTADVHYCAAHEYSPERAAFKNFTPFWEFVAGPINAGTFGPNALDLTFGPRVDFYKSGPRVNASPLEGGQYFGHVAIEGGSGEMTVKLIEADVDDKTDGTVVYEKTLSPQRG